MEMELLYSRAIDMNGGLGDSDDGVGTEKGSSILRQKYERAAKDLEYAKKRLAQQHEDDMEQLMALKKQLEKKVIQIWFLDYTTADRQFSEFLGQTHANKTYAIHLSSINRLMMLQFSMDL